MSWEYEYNETTDETTIYWDNEKQTTVDGQISRWRNGYPAAEKVREAIADVIQSAGTPERIRMQFDFNYGFSERSDDQS